MNTSRFMNELLSLTTTQLSLKIANDLNCHSPLIGANGPPASAGPEERYILATEGFEDEDNSSALAQLGDAVTALLLEQAMHLKQTHFVRSPLLLFNLCAWMEAVQLPPTHTAFCDLRLGYEAELRNSLAKYHENLYARLLLAYAGNQQGSSDDVRFWLDLLNSQDPDKILAAVAGLRHSGFENAMAYLPLVEKTHWTHRDLLGEFEDEVILLIDTYADRIWPDCAQVYYPNYGESRIRELVEKYSTCRYQPRSEELQDVSGSRTRVFRGINKTSIEQLKFLTPQEVQAESRRNDASASSDRIALQLACYAALQYARTVKREWADAVCNVLLPRFEKWLRNYERTHEIAWTRLCECIPGSTKAIQFIANRMWVASGRFAGFNDFRPHLKKALNPTTRPSVRDLRADFDNAERFSVVGGKFE